MPSTEDSKSQNISYLLKIASPNTLICYLLKIASHNTSICYLLKMTNDKSQHIATINTKISFKSCSLGLANMITTPGTKIGGNCVNLSTAMQPYAAFRLACRLPHWCFEGDICKTAQDITWELQLWNTKRWSCGEAAMRWAAS